MLAVWWTRVAMVTVLIVRCKSAFHGRRQKMCVGQHGGQMPAAQLWQPVGQLRRTHQPVSFSSPRIIDQRFEKVAYFVFGDFNFRLDSKSVVEVGTWPSPVCSPHALCCVRKSLQSSVVLSEQVQCHPSHWLHFRQKLLVKTCPPVKNGATVGLRDELESLRPLQLLLAARARNVMPWKFCCHQQCSASRSSLHMSAK